MPLTPLKQGRVYSSLQSGLRTRNTHRVSSTWLVRHIYYRIQSLTNTGSTLQADVSDVAKGNFLEFSISIHGHKHQFQAMNKAEKDGWLVAIETKRAEAQAGRGEIVGSDGYKSALEKYGKLTILIS